MGSGKQLKKCKKGAGKPAKQDKKNKKEGKAAKKAAKKEKKEKKKNKSMEFESMGLSKKEIKKLKKQAAEEEATRSEGVSFDSADAVEDDNQMFAGWTILNKHTYFFLLFTQIIKLYYLPK